MNPKTFIHLHVHSAYSLAEGAITVKDLVKLCAANDMPAVAVTDTNNLFGAMEFATEAAKAGIQPILGAQLTVGQPGHQLVLLVQNETGYRNLSKLVSETYMNSADGAQFLASEENLAAHSEGLICLTGGLKGAAAQALLHHRPEEARQTLQDLLKMFPGRLYMELQRHGWSEEEAVEEALIDLAYDLKIPLVATNDSYFKNRKAYEAHDALLCIAEGRYISESDRRRVTPEHDFKSAQEMIDLFSDLPEATANTAVIAQRCSFLLRPAKSILPAFTCESGRTESEELQEQARAGLEWRLEKFVFEGSENKEKREKIAKPYRERLEFELKTIIDMGFPGYFLIVSDFIRWAKDQNIPVGPGRGSGAGSVVAWSLKITDLDPLALGLLFERFLNPERVSMPDFDVDFCQDRRDEVIRYVQQRYGYDRVAQIITFGKLQARAVVRDVGRVLQMPYGQVDRIAKLIPNNPANPITLEQALEQDAELRNERDKDETQRKLIDIALQLEGLYRHASTHAAGVVISDRPLHEVVPLYRDPRSDMPVTQFNMKSVEQAGLIKFDFLGLKTMTVIQRTLDMLKAKNCKIETLDIPLDDPKSYALMSAGDTVGVFQLESAGMRDTLRKMKPNRFEDIIALVSLYRPGPMDNIPKYISVKEEKEAPDYLHPVLRPYLEETYGIMIYQEQVMQAAQSLAGYSLGGADLLRRAMGKKIKEEMDAQRDMFLKGAKESHDVSADQAAFIFEQIAKFAGYGFNKSHAAAYALIAYWTAWLKANYPEEFMAASMTYDKGNTDKLALFKQDLDRMGISLLPPDINASQADFSVENGAVRYALAALKGVGEHAMQALVQEREKDGKFTSLEDFAKRIDPKSMNRRQLEQMAAAGAFDSVVPDRAQVFAGAETILRYAQTLQNERASGQVSLFGDAQTGNLGMPDLPKGNPWTPLEQLGFEFSAIGFYLSAHPLDSRRSQLDRMNILSIADLETQMREKPALRVKMAGVLLKKSEKVSQKGNRYAFLQLSDPTGVYEVTVFSDILHETREILEPGQTLLLTVDAEQREDQLRMTCFGLEPLDKQLEGRIMNISIVLDSAAPAKRIKEFLEIEGAGNSAIELFILLDHRKTAVLSLPGRWSLSAQARDVLRVQKGILKVTEH
ncbi:MAG: DNA polymerase III subunit alpha [Alphaproteobacteria bacterium]|nr:DNA polymerase III subunit alpha [Alphaproteobacteria bacterium]